MSSKPKVIIKFPGSQLGRAGEVAKALRTKFGAFEVVPGVTGTFDFTVVQTGDNVDIVAEGVAWNLPGNQRPAWGTMATWAEGYSQCLADGDSAESPTKLE